MPRAASLAAAIARQHPTAKVETRPGGRGDFVVTADNRVLWDKRKQNDEFPAEAQILAQLGK